MKTGKSILFAFLLLYTLNATASGERKGIKYKAILIKSLKEKIQVEEFNCEDRVIIYFTWFGLKDSHFIRALWYKPGGKLQETAEHNFNAGNKREINTWLWLKLKKGKEKGFIFPERGWLDFIGQWYVEIFLDGRFIVKKKFHISC